MNTETVNIEIKHNSGMVYVPGKTYYVAGARSAWDTVKVGLYESRLKADQDWALHQNKSFIREATELEVKEFFGLI